MKNNAKKRESFDSPTIYGIKLNKIKQKIYHILWSKFELCIYRAKLQKMSIFEKT